MNVLIDNLIPKFLLADKNGFALAKAIEAGLQKAAEILDTGKALMSNYDTMPEWRLDEIAWETNCVYNYSASIEQKRIMIKNAVENFRLYGTPSGVIQSLEPFFKSVEITEGETPFHFGVTIVGEITSDNMRFARRAVENVKNVRSVFDGFRYKDTGNLGAQTIDRAVVLNEFVLDVDTLG